MIIEVEEIDPRLDVCTRPGEGTDATEDLEGSVILLFVRRFGERLCGRTNRPGAS
jgi:hypothetical protein